MPLRTERAAAGSPAGGGEERSSRALPTVLGRLGTDHKTVVADLGPASEDNLRFLSQFSCRLHIGDLFDALLAAGAFTDSGAEEEEVDVAAVCAEALALGDGEQLDIILAWNLFDYLRRDQISALGGALARHCAPGALLYATVSYHKLMPARPGRHDLLSPDTLVYRPAGAATRPSPLYKEPDLARLLTGFTVDQAFLLRHGQHEYLFAWPGDS